VISLKYFLKWCLVNFSKVETHFFGLLNNSGTNVIFDLLCYWAFSVSTYGQNDRNLSMTSTMQQNEYWIIFLVVELINQFIENDILYKENELLLIILLIQIFARKVYVE